MSSFGPTLRLREDGYETPRKSLNLHCLWTLHFLFWSSCGSAGSIGPFGALLSNNDVISGQMNALAIDPRDANTLYVGAAEGGVWKTSNGGAS